MRDPDSRRLAVADAVPATHGGVPFSPRFGDVYHAHVGAFAQADHVFLRGNGLPGRWRARRAFTVAETGFGLGLNFLALWHAWREDPARCARLHVLSVEAHPFTRADLARWLDHLVPPAMRRLAHALVAAWPLPLPGQHRLVFEDGAVSLTLGFGEAASVVPQWQAAVDAYFLDGFSPARNPAMWSDSLMQALARHAAPGATAATWTSAGAVRRALAQAGFTVRKVPGFSGKRDMTVAEHVHGGALGREVQAAARAPGTALVIGAGVAGAGAADALAQAGWTVQVLAPVQGADSAHVAAALTPQVDREDSVRARLARAGALSAARRWAPVTAMPGEPIGDAVAVRCGTIQVMPRRQARDAASAEAWRAGMAALTWPPDWLRLVSADEAAALAGQSVGRAGLYLPGGLQVLPPRLCAYLLGHPAITRQDAQVARLSRQGEQWQAHDGAGRVLGRADIVVLAAAGAVPGLLAASGIDWPLGSVLQQVAGQVSLVPVAGMASPYRAPACIVAGDGYVLPAVAGRAIVGSTYDHVTPPGAPAPVTAAGHATNLAHWHTLLPGAATAVVPDGIAGWAGWRAVLPGRLPAVGTLPGAPGLYLTTAHASRGMSWSALGGQCLADWLAGAPSPLERELAACVAPGRRAAG